MNLLNGVRLWYVIAGHRQQGQAPLLFLHGGPGYNTYSFRKTIGPQLENRLQMIYLEERGSGRSERPANHDYTMSSLVADIEALRKHLGLDQISLIGHSFGGTIALEYAAHYPKHVQKLIILDGAADMPATFNLWRSEIEQRYPEAWKTILDSDAGHTLKESEKYGDICQIAKAEFSADMKALATVNSQEFHNWQQFHDRCYQQEQTRFDQESGLHNTGEFSNAYFGQGSEFPCYRFEAYQSITMPTLVMVGKFDGAVGVIQMRSLAHHLAHVRFDEFEHSAHFPYAEDPSKFVRDVTEFLANP